MQSVGQIGPSFYALGVSFLGETSSFQLCEIIIIIVKCPKDNSSYSWVKDIKHGLLWWVYSWDFIWLFKVTCLYNFLISSGIISVLHIYLISMNTQYCCLLRSCLCISSSVFSLTFAWCGMMSQFCSVKVIKYFVSRILMISCSTFYDSCG